MGLVDYSSDSGSDSRSESSTSPSAKPKPSQSPRAQSSIPPSNTLPPLPSAFHDLYAHTVRQSASDDPTLHQGRRRHIPHVPGNWPSHVYLEWRPSSTQHELLTSFLSSLQSELGEKVEINTFLTSELGAPLPLHVSLSRPFVLSTAEKDEFLEKLIERVRGSGVRPFVLSCQGGVEWHRTEESSRSFLVLRVRSEVLTGDRQRLLEQDGTGKEESSRNKNPMLTTLLTKCNATVAAYNQPQLYQWADDIRIGDAFHVSLAWSFSEIDQELRKLTGEVFANLESLHGLKNMDISVDGIKAKIGNVVHHIPLEIEKTKRSRGLFGI